MKIPKLIRPEIVIKHKGNGEFTVQSNTDFAKYAKWLAWLREVHPEFIEELRKKHYNSMYGKLNKLS